MEEGKERSIKMIRKTMTSLSNSTNTIPRRVLKLTTKQKDKLRTLQRLALIQMGHFRQSTPARGLEAITDTMPLDLHIQAEIIKVRIRLKDNLQRNWSGGNTKKWSLTGHIKRSDTLLSKMGLPDTPTDKTTRTHMWDKPYEVNHESLLTGEDIVNKTGTQIYTDGSRINHKAGYGAATYQGNEEMAATKGNLGFNATVYQGECIAITEGIHLAQEMNLQGNVDILTDNQAIFKALDGNWTDSRTTTDTYQALKSLAETNTVTIHWIKAHVGFIGNERADTLAKEGANELSIGCEPRAPISKSVFKRHIDLELRKEWNEQWKNRKDCRQTRIVFPEINPKKGQEMRKLKRDTLSRMVRALTGHDFRNRHNSIVEQRDFCKCRLCQEGDENLDHLITECKELARITQTKQLWLPR